MNASFLSALGHTPSDRRVAILREIDARGSISQAARAVGVSYKAAWQAVDTLTNLAGVPLVARVVGGAGGGGATLTPAGHDLLAAAQAMDDARGAVLGRWPRQAQASGAPLSGALLGLAVQTSMRNQVPCVVRSLKLEGAIARVFLDFLLSPEQAGASTAKPQAPAQSSQTGAVSTSGASGQAALVARITRESAELLALQPGVQVQALCKATAVQVVRCPDPDGSPDASVFVDSSADCLLPARAIRVMRGALGDEITAGLSWCGYSTGLHMVGFATAHSRLRAGSPVTLRVEENAWVLALASV